MELTPMTAHRFAFDSRVSPTSRERAGQSYQKVKMTLKTVIIVSALLLLANDAQGRIKARVAFVRPPPQGLRSMKSPTTAVATPTLNQVNNVIVDMNPPLPQQEYQKGPSFEQAASTTVATKQKEYRSAILRTSLAVSAAVLFGVLLTATRGLATGHEFFAGYLVEQTLSIDNLFAFIMMFDYFHVPMELQSRVLTWGVAGAVALRGLMIAVGVRAIQRFQSVILVFASILLASSFKLLTETEKDKEDYLDDNVVMKFTRAVLPNTSADFHGERFFVTNEMGKRIATPLFLCLVCVELSDFVFAVDSIPAVLGVSKDPLVVFASNIFAMLTMRSLYTLVAKAVTELRYLKPAVATVLAFVGTKMIGEYFHVVIGTGASLGVICSVLGAGIIASIWEKKQKRLRLPSVRFPSWAKMTLAG